MKELEKQYKALANRRRLEILKYLSSGRRATVGDIAAHIKLHLKATSQHLKILSGVEFVDREQKSLHVFYFLPDRKPKVLENFLKTF
jgi:DNA-binding transcriptional ArsR family regulator